MPAKKKAKKRRGRPVTSTVANEINAHLVRINQAWAAIGLLAVRESHRLHGE